MSVKIAKCLCAALLLTIISANLPVNCAVKVLQSSKAEAFEKYTVSVIKADTSENNEEMGIGWKVFAVVVFLAFLTGFGPALIYLGVGAVLLYVLARGLFG